MVGRRVLVSVTIILLAIGLFGFVLPKTGFSIAQETVVNDKYLEDLRQQAGLECLKDSQCSESYVCVGNTCVAQTQVDLCKKVSLSTGAEPIEVGESINSAKNILTKSDLPYLLSDGKLLEIIDNNITEYMYTSSIIVGERIVEQENNTYIIGNISSENPLYTLKIDFSKPVDFSSKKIKGQALKIFGEEYVISGSSNNEVVELISNSKKIILEEGKKIRTETLSSAEGTSVNLRKNEDGKIIGFEIDFREGNINQEKIKVGNNHIDSGFKDIKLSFDSINQNKFAELSIGGNC